MKVTKIVKEEGVASEDGSCSLHGNHALLSLLPFPPLLHPYHKQTIEVTVTAIFLPGIVYLL
jgi:hypothetical protein